MYTDTQLNEFYRMSREMKEMALRLYNKSGDFPAINRNCKRVLASVEMMMINLQGAEKD